VKKRVGFWLLGFVLAFLLGCSPEFNWREMGVADGRATLAFPAKVQTEQRQIQIGGETLAFSLSAANVGPAVFAIGFAALPENLSESAQQTLTRALLTSLFAASGKVPTQDALEGKVFELETLVAKQPSILIARVLVHRGMLLQVVASGPKQDLPREQALEFMRSLALK
jgi:hypothetical protein